MSRILYRARSPRGDYVADFVEAASAAEAMGKLSAANLQDIVLLQSPDIAAFNMPLPGITAQQQARLRAEFMDRPGLATGFRAVIRLNALVFVVALATLAFGAWRHLPVVAVGGAVLFVLPFALYLWKRRHLDRYQALQKAYARGQWDEVRRIAPMLLSVTQNALLPWDLDVRLACIDARQGRLDEALARLEPWKSKLDPKAPGMFEARLSGVHAAAGQYDAHVRLMQQAADLGNQDPARLVDVALANAKFGDPRKAEDILHSLDAKLLPPLAHKFIALIKGVLQLREGHPDAAAGELRIAVEGFFESSLKSPAAWVGLAISSGYQAVALARCGKRGEAQQVVATALPILLVHGEKPLMDMLQDEVLQRAA